MAKCTYCGANNIDGVDNCEQCLEPLGEVDLTRNESDVERSLLNDKVQLLLPRKPILVNPSKTVHEVLQIMVERSIGCVLVCEDGDRLIGIFSERDAVVRIGTSMEELRDHSISEFMTASPETIDADAQIAFALQKMDVGGYRHLPVTSQDRIVGVISIRDILTYLARNLEVVEY